MRPRGTQSRWGAKKMNADFKDTPVEGREGTPAPDAGSQLRAIADAGFNRMATDRSGWATKAGGGDQLPPAWRPPKEWIPSSKDSRGKDHFPSDAPSGPGPTEVPPRPKPPRDPGSAVPSGDAHPHTSAGGSRHDEAPRSPHSSRLEDFINERRNLRAKEEARDEWNRAAIKRAELRDPGLVGDLARRDAKIRRPGQ